jgi:RNA polymerase sigma-70 factor (ECF subfamily)
MEHENLKQLFQQEFAKMVAVISKLYGLQHIEIVEDIATQTFLLAAENWKNTGVPANPVAWLYKIAKQKTLYHFRRNKIYNEKIMPELVMRRETEEEIVDLDFSKQNIKDSQLRMLFAICTPAIASEAQIGLALRILCGFGIDEIAEAFLSNKETINKRLFRAKEKLRTEKVVLEMPGENAIVSRLDNVLHIIYLLFSEGYYSKTNNTILRKDLCLEALQLGIMLSEYAKTNLPKTNALLALMCFHTSRFDARQTGQDMSILYDQQDISLWDTEMIKRGMYFLNLSAQGGEISSYHLEAKIAYWHCLKDDTYEKWGDILHLYNELLLINYSPSVALNRTYALYRANGLKEALIEAGKLKLEHNHFYYLLLGELYSTVDKEQAKRNYEKACVLAKTQTEQHGIRKKINSLTNDYWLY